MNYKKSLVILATAHVVCGPIAGFYAGGYLDSSTAIYAGLLFSQTSLLGIWGGLATTGWPRRLAGVTIGIAYLVAQFGFARAGWKAETFLLIFLSTVSVAGVMLVVRRFRARLDRTGTAIISVGAEGLQFSIRHLMLLTLVVSCMLTIGRWLQPYFQSSNEWAIILAMGLCFVSVGVTSVWAMLGRSHLMLRSGVVLFIALLTACIPAYVMGREEWWYWATMMIVEASVLLVSLFVVRRCGFRLVRISYSSNELPEVS